METFLWPVFLFHRFKKSICHLMAKGCTLSTDNLPVGDMPRNSVGRITDRPDMISAVYCGNKASILPTKDTYMYLVSPCVKAYSGEMGSTEVEVSIVLEISTGSVVSTGVAVSIRVAVSSGVVGSKEVLVSVL